MCGRYVTPNNTAIEKWWKTGLPGHNVFQASFNAAPTTQVPMIYLNADNHFALTQARWGLIPHWWSQPKLPAMTFNARSEEAKVKPMWRDSYKRWRCIMPASGWYEWQIREEVDSLTGEVKEIKQPYYLYAENEPVVGIAGLLSFWQTPEQEQIITCALMTKSASTCVSTVHDRMPVILPRAQCAEWLNPDLKQDDVARMVNASATEFSFHAASKSVNNARNSGEGLIARIQP